MMNESNLEPQRTDKFTPQQVCGLEFKMEKRLKRLDKIENSKIISIGLIKTKKKFRTNVICWKSIFLNIHIELSKTLDVLME